MQIDISKLLKGDTNVIEFAYTTTLPEDLSDIHFTDDLSIKGNVRDMAGFMNMTITAEIPYDTHCARCFREVHKVFKTVYEKPVAVVGTLTDEDSEDYLPVQKSGILDPDPAISEFMLLDFPMVDLCKDDCKGLCPKCGQDLNEGVCSCPQKDMDPRWAILGKLLDK